MTRLLIFVAGALPWLRLDDTGVVARGDDAASRPAGDDREIIAVVPGESVALHWVELPALAPAQAAAAARLLAADVSATPIDGVHVATGAADDEGFRVLALVDAALMAGWIDRLGATGLIPDAIVPLPLLLLPPDAGVAVFDAGGCCNARGPRLAFGAEAEVAELLLAGETRHPVDRAGFEAGLATAIASLPLNLRQGRFALRRAAPVAPARIRRLALLAGAAALAWLAAGLAGLAQSSLAANRADVRLADAARAALPRGTVVTDPRAQVAARLAGLGGGDHGFSALATPLFAAVRNRPDTAIRSLQYGQDAGIAAVIEARSPDAAPAVAAALVAGGLKAATANPRVDGNHSVADVTVQWP